MNLTEYLQWEIKKRNNLPDVLNALGYTEGAEVGVWEAEYAEKILASSAVQTLHLIDPWTAVGMTRTETTGEEAMMTAMKRLAPFPGRYVLHRGLSEEVHTRFEDGSLDFIYLDASHDYDNVKQDLGFWVPKVRKGGLMMGHDYNNRGYKRVKKAVDEYFGEENVNKTCGERVASWFVAIL